MIRYLIIDDEQIAHDILKDYCKMLPSFELVGNCYDALEAMDILGKKKVDLVFLDLNMPKLKGFDFIRTLAKPPKIIVTTAYKEYALEGYELNVVDYLLKPFDFNRFLKAVNKVVNQPNKASANVVALPKDQSIFVKSDKKYVQIQLADIIYLESTGNYTKIIQKNGSLMVRDKISSLLVLLNSDAFIRVHKSFGVSITHIESIEGNMIHIAGKIIPIGNYYKSNITELI